jgi:hypothetical protein
MNRFFFGLGVLLCVLKYTGYISISWFLATLPIFWWFYVFLFAYITAIVVMVLVIIWAIGLQAKERFNEREQLSY